MTDVYLAPLTVESKAAIDRMLKVAMSRSFETLREYLRSGQYDKDCVLDKVLPSELSTVVAVTSDLLTMLCTFTELDECEADRRAYRELCDQIINTPHDESTMDIETQRERTQDKIRLNCAPKPLRRRLDFRAKALLLLARDGTAFRTRNAYAFAELLNSDACQLFHEIIASELSYETWIEIGKLVVGDVRLKLQGGSNSLLVQTSAVGSPWLAKACLTYIVRPNTEHRQLIEKLQRLESILLREFEWLPEERLDALSRSVADIETTDYWRYRLTGAKGRCVRQIINIALGLVGLKLSQYVMLWIIQEALPQCTSRTEPRPRVDEARVISIVESVIKRYQESQERRQSELENKQQKNLNY